MDVLGNIVESCRNIYSRIHMWKWQRKQELEEIVRRFMERVESVYKY